MESSQFTKLRPTSRPESEPSTNLPRATYATERAEVLFGGYRRGDANDPERYVAAIAAVLACYEPDLIREATDPRTGISAAEKFMSFMPNSGELKAFCDALAQRRRRMGEYAAMPRSDFRRLEAPPRGPGARANVFCSASNGRYQVLCERAENPASNALDFRYDVERGGIWVNQNWL
jgi:hypothetical protein